MRGIGIAGIAGKRPFQQALGLRHLAGLHLREAVLGEEPPVIAVMRRQPVGEGQLLGLAPRSPAEADKPEHAAAGLGDHCVQRPFPEMGEDCGIGARPVAIDQEAERVQMAGLPGRAPVCGSARRAHRVRRLAPPPSHLQRPRLPRMGEREGRVFQSGARKTCSAPVLAPRNRSIAST